MDGSRKHTPALSYCMKDGKLLLKCHGPGNCDFKTIISVLPAEERPFLSGRFTTKTVEPDQSTPVEVARWVYTSESDEPLYEVARMEPGRNGKTKDFVQFLPGASRPGGTQHVRRVLYRLPDVLAAIGAEKKKSIYVVEGEKCADAINQHHENTFAIATTNSGGSSQWKDELAESLTGAVEVIVWRDKDNPGYVWSTAVRDSLRKRKIPHWIVESAKHHDAADHLAAGESIFDTVPVADPGAVKSLRVAEVLSEPEPATPWLMKNWLADGDRVVLAGAPKMGKSCILLDLALALATGTRWLGMFHVERPQRVVYLDEEQTEILARQRIHRAVSGRLMSPEEIGLADSNLLYLHGNRMNLASQERAETLRKAILDHAAQWVLVDTLKRIHSCDENSAEEVSAFMDGVLLPVLGQAGCVLLSHFRKGQVAEEGVLDAVRGSGDFGAWADSVWGYIRDGEQRKLVPAVSRWDGNPRAVHVLKNGNSLQAESATDADELVAQLILESKQTGVDRADLVQAVLNEIGCSDNTASVSTSRSIKKLSSEGTISRQKIGRRTRYWMRQHAPADAENDVSK